MENNNVIQQLDEKEQGEEGIPICGANLVSPVTDTANYIGEVHYKIGTRLYIENAD
jgi:hypothetical protein